MSNAKTLTLPNGVKQQVYRSGQGPALVWLHGLERYQPDDAVVSALAKHYTVFAPIVPGYADLNDAIELRDVHDLALHYDTLLGELGLDQAIVVGHSFGGMIAAELAAHVPQRVSQLGLIAPLGLWSDDYPVTDIVARLYPEMIEVLWQGAVGKRSAAGGTSAPQNDAERVEQMVAIANGLATVSKYTWPIPDRGLRHRLYRIAAPTVIIFGEQDAYIPHRYADDFSSGIRNSKVLRFPGSHMVPYERPGDIVAAIAATAGAGGRRTASVA